MRAHSQCPFSTYDFLKQIPFPRKVEMTPGRQGGLTRLHLLPEFCAMGGPLSAYPAPPDCLAAAGVVDRPADGSADMTPAAPARTPVPRRAAYSRRSRRAPPSGSCRTPGTAARHRRAGQRSARPGNSPPRPSCPRARAQGRRVQQKHHPVVAQREIAGDLALLRATPGSRQDRRPLKLEFARFVTL